MSNQLDGVAVGQLWYNRSTNVTVRVMMVAQDDLADVIGLNIAIVSPTDAPHKKVAVTHHEFFELFTPVAEPTPGSLNTPEANAWADMLEAEYWRFDTARKSGASGERLVFKDSLNFVREYIEHYGPLKAGGR